MQHKSFLNNIVRLLLLFIGFNIIGSIVTIILLKSLFNLDSISVLNNIQSQTVDSSSIVALKFMQLIQVFFSFIIPAHLFAKQQSGNQIVDYLHLNITHYKHFIFGVLLIFAISPVVSYLSIINDQIHFPSYLSSLELFFRNQQTQSEKFSLLFLRDNTGLNLAINIFIVGVLAAISEELFFRGVLQKILFDSTKNIHLSIFICSVVFSALHQEFYSIIPRVLLGMLLGYAFVFSKSLWVPILIHFVNNASAVLLDSLYKQNIISFNPNSNEYFGITGIIVSLITTIALFWYWKKNKEASLVIYYGEKLD